MNQIRVANFDKVIVPDKVPEEMSKKYKITRNMDTDMQDVWKACKYCVEHYLPYIRFANDVLKIPPTKTFLDILKQMYSDKNKGTVKFADPEAVLKKIKAGKFTFERKDAQKIGAFWGYIFKEKLGYKRVEKPVRINTFGITSASLFEKGDGEDAEYIVLENYMCD